MPFHDSKPGSHANQRRVRRNAQTSPKGRAVHVRVKPLEIDTPLKRDDALRRLLESPEFGQVLARAGRELIERRYSGARVAERLGEIYGSLAERQSR